MEERSWFLVQASHKYDHSLNPLSKKAQNRHEPRLRETDGAVRRPKLTQRMDDPHHSTRTRNFNKWLEALSDASHRVRFECCHGPHVEPQYIRAVQGHGDVPRIDPKFFTLREIPCELFTQIYHAGSSQNYRSIVER